MVLLLMKIKEGFKNVRCRECGAIATSKRVKLHEINFRQRTRDNPKFKISLCDAHLRILHKLIGVYLSDSSNSENGEVEKDVSGD